MFSFQYFKDKLFSRDLVTPKDLQDFAEFIGGSGGVSEKITQTGNLVLADFLPSEKTDGFTKEIQITGSGNIAHTLEAPSGWENKNNVSLLSTKFNVVIAKYIQAINKVIFVNSVYDIPDTTAPLFNSALVTNANLITVNLSKNAAGTANFSSDISFTSQTIVGSTVQIVTASTIIPGQSIPLSGGTGITNLSGTVHFAGLSNYSVTNNLSSFSNTKSLAASLTTPAGITGLDFGSNDGNSLNEFSVSFYGRPLDFNEASGTFVSYYWPTRNSSLFVTFNQSGGIFFGIYGDTGGRQHFETTANEIVSLNTWVHITVTVTQNTYLLYVNGVLTATSKTGNNVEPTATKDAASKWTFLDASPASIHALLDEVLIWNRVLTTPEAAAVHSTPDATQLSFYTSAKAGHWRFENNKNDSSGNGNTLVGTATYSTEHP